MFIGLWQLRVPHHRRASKYICDQICRFEANVKNEPCQIISDCQDEMPHFAKSALNVVNNRPNQHDGDKRGCSEYIYRAAVGGFYFDSNRLVSSAPRPDDFNHTRTYV
jgi:hypothetical protein